MGAPDAKCRARIRRCRAAPGNTCRRPVRYPSRACTRPLRQAAGESTSCRRRLVPCRLPDQSRGPCLAERAAAGQALEWYACRLSDAVKPSASPISARLAARPCPGRRMPGLERSSRTAGRRPACQSQAPLAGTARMRAVPPLRRRPAGTRRSAGSVGGGRLDTSIATRTPPPLPAGPTWPAAALPCPRAADAASPPPPLRRAMRAEPPP